MNKPICGIVVFAGDTMEVYTNAQKLQSKIYKHFNNGVGGTDEQIIQLAPIIWPESKLGAGFTEAIIRDKAENISNHGFDTLLFYNPNNVLNMRAICKELAKLFAGTPKKIIYYDTILNHTGLDELGVEFIYSTKHAMGGDEVHEKICNSLSNVIPELVFGK